MRNPDLISRYEFNGHVDVAWYDVLEKDAIPDLEWHQVYIVGNYEGGVPIVTYPNAQDNLPGGKTEPGESLEQTIAREVEEELNMRVVSWEPLGYQACTQRETGEVSYQFRAYATLEKLNDYVNYGVVGQRLVANAKQYFIEE